MKKLSIVIPCYNEEEALPNLAQQLDPVIDSLNNQYDIELIFIDDGSTDQTYQLLQKYYGKKNQVKIIKHDRNRNLGAALKTGFFHTQGDLVAVFDSDCTYPPSLLPAMLDLMDEHTDIVTVSPYHPHGRVENVPAYRLILSKGVSYIYRFLLNSGIYTHGAMVRVYKKEVLDRIKFKANDFLAVTELLIKAKLSRCRIKELPTSLKLREYGTSKMKLMNTIKSHLKLIQQIILYKTIRKRF